MKKAIGLLSAFLALAIVTCSVTPVLSETIRDAFSVQPRVASVDRSETDNHSVTDNAAAYEEETSGNASNQPEVAYDDGKILI